MFMSPAHAMYFRREKRAVEEKTEEEIKGGKVAGVIGMS